MIAAGGAIIDAMRLVLWMAVAALCVGCSSESTNAGSGGGAGTPSSGGTGGTPASGGTGGTSASGGTGGTPASGGASGSGGSAGQGNCVELVHDVFGATNLDAAWVQQTDSLELFNGVLHLQATSLQGEAYQTTPALSQFSSLVLTAKVHTVNAGDVVSLVLGEAAAPDTMSVAFDASAAPVVRLQQGTNAPYEWTGATVGATYILELTYAGTSAKLRVLDNKSAELDSKTTTAVTTTAKQLVIRLEKTAGFGPTLDDITLSGCSSK